MAKAKKKINKKALLSLIPIVIAFLINRASVLRLILCLIGIGIFIYFIKSKKIFGIAFITIILLVLCDSLISYTFKRIPIFSYNIITNNNVRVYNSFGIRVWQCDKNSTKDLKVDLFSSQGYMCDIEDIDTVYSNSFLSTVVENYSDYKDEYVKINGKISKKNGLNYIEMQTYDPNSEDINGTVNFYTNITLRILFDENQEELNNYDVYDNVTIVGVIKNLDSSDGNHYVYMYEAKVVSIKDVSDFDLSFTTESKCSEKTLLYSDDDNEIYQYCLLNTVVTYDDGTKYELGNVLSSGKLSLDLLLNNYEDKVQSSTDGSILYKFKKYNILVCDGGTSNDVIIGSTKLDFDTLTCE